MTEKETLRREGRWLVCDLPHDRHWMIPVDQVRGGYRRDDAVIVFGANGREFCCPPGYTAEQVRALIDEAEEPARPSSDVKMVMINENERRALDLAIEIDALSARVAELEAEQTPDEAHVVFRPRPVMGDLSEWHEWADAMEGNSRHLVNLHDRVCCRLQVVKDERDGARSEAAKLLAQLRYREEELSTLRNLVWLARAMCDAVVVPFCKADWQRMVKARNNLRAALDAIPKETADA